MRLLVTGGAGSLGSNLIEHVGDRCDAVLVVDNYATGKPQALLPRGNLTVVEGTIEDAALVDRLFGEFAPTHVVHSAASYKDPNDWVRDASVNVIGTINVVRASERAGVRRFVNFQTALCFGRPSTVPIPADHPTRPFTSYGVSKTAGEAVVQASSLDWVSLRIANVTGPRLAIGPMPAFYKRLKAGEPCSVSTTVRDFLDMSDFLSLMDLVLAASGRGTYNVSTGEGHTIQEVFEVVARHLGISGATPAAVNPPGADDVAAVVLDPSETARAFGWAAKVGFEETVLRMLRWYDEHGITDVYSHLQGQR
jgi:nucleoside-diphosphate-sugar epimerase